MGTRLAARRHRQELGATLHVHADRPGPVTTLGIVAAWLLFCGLTLINPGRTVLLAIAPSVAFTVIWGLILLYLSGERLLVCERGLIIGSVAPFVRQYVVPYDQITPGSIVPVTGVQRYPGEVGAAGFPQSTVRRYWWTQRGIHLVGPSAPEARRHRAVMATLLDPRPRSIDRRWLWFAGTGRRPPEQVTAQIAEAAHRSGATALARATAGAPVRELSGRPADAAAHLPGLPPQPPHHPRAGPGIAGSG